MNRRKSFADILPGNIGMFVRGTISDLALRRSMSIGMTPAKAFDKLYTKDADPWRSASPEYRYQDQKYKRMLDLISGLRFARALDLGCGPGLFTHSLASVCNQVVGVGLSEVALVAARQPTLHETTASGRVDGIGDGRGDRNDAGLAGGAGRQISRHDLDHDVGRVGRRRSASLRRGQPQGARPGARNARV